MNTHVDDLVESASERLVISDEDIALFSVLPEEMDYVAQLSAIRNLLHRHRQADRLLEDQIKEIDEFAKRTTGLINQNAVDDWVDHLHASVYQDAAHSMAAVGMLAPFVESILYQSFIGLHRNLSANTVPFSSHPRWQWSTEQQWDCHFVYAKNGQRSKNFVEGVLQLAEAVGLTAHLPSDLRPILEALFKYRNNMFHEGFEWSKDERQKFGKYIKDKNWPSDWFTVATSGSEPWVFYMTDTFIDHCLVTINQVLRGIGAFARERSSPDESAE